MSDLIDRQMALDAIMGQPPEPHYPSWYAAQIKKLPAVQPDHVADIGKKVEGDCISRQAAIDALARMMPRSYTPDGSHPADEEIFRAQEVFADCIEALEIQPSAQPATSCSEIPNGSDDTISRQAAIDALWKALYEYEDKTEKQFQESEELDVGDWIGHRIFVQNMSDIDRQTILNLPSVQPDHNADISKKAEGDCISRQAVVKFFNDWISCLDENCHHQSVADMTIIKNDFKNLPSAQPEQQWIPCSERLPKEKQSVLVTDGTVIWVCDIISTDEGYKWEDSHGYWLDLDEWTAWRPLPEPYQGGDSE